VSRNELCFCGSGKKKKKCHRDIEPGSAFAHMVNLYNRLDDTIQKGIGNIRCRKGCFACCYQYFTITSVEFYYIISQMMAEQGMTKVQEFIDRGYQDYLTYEEKYPEIIQVLKENHSNKNADNQDFMVQMNRIMQTNKNAPMHNPNPCPFLDPETKGCSVYEYRPSVCRTYGVSYETIIEQPFMMCEHIEDGLSYQSEMADVSQYSEELMRLGAFVVNEQVIVDKPYPIFYFCKIIKENPQSLTIKINEYQSYSLQEVMNRKAKRSRTS
jgi:Fe-S-cluster containining protein